MIRHSVKGAALAAVVLMLFAGCRPANIGYGVLLWSTDESVITSGSVVTIRSEAQIANTYIIESDALAEPLVYPMWRVERFAELPAAEQFAARYNQNLGGNPALLARSVRAALPMRTSPASLATNTLYRLREGEIIKLIGRQDELTDIQGLVAYWWEALTETGERGWVFGYTLSLFDPTDPTVVIDSAAGGDPLLDLLLQNVWRPIWFVEMIRNRSIDLDVFDERYGLFPRPEDRQFELALPWHATVFEYDRVVSGGARRYVAEGTSLRFTFQRNDELSVQYTHDGRQFSQAFQRIDGEVADYIAAELGRRQARFDRFADRGPVFVSDNYGRLSFADDQRFTWTGYDRLVPRIVASGAASRGRLDLGLSVARQIAADFDGAIGFRFDGTQQSATFLYAFETGGVRLVHIPAANIEERVVMRTDGSVLTIFMSALDE